MAAQQAALRQKLQEYLDNQKKQGELGNGGLNEALKLMEQNERDLINKRITRQTIIRQQHIQTRLLRAEKAELEREKEEKRESKSAKQIFEELYPEIILLENLDENSKEKLFKSQPKLKESLKKSYILYLNLIKGNEAYLFGL